MKKEKTSKLSDSWSTPQSLFDEINKAFGPCVLDVCANSQNTKCVSYFTEQDNALEQEWFNKNLNISPQICWMNPPYSDPYPWLKKATEEVKKGNVIVVSLLKADHSTSWYKDFIYDYNNVRFYPGVERIDLPKRVKFVAPPGLINKKTGKPVKEGSPNYPSMVVVFRPTK